MIIMFFGPNFKIGKLQIPCEFRKIMNVLSFVVYYIYVGVNNFIFTVSHIHTINLSVYRLSMKPIKVILKIRKILKY